MRVQVDQALSLGIKEEKWSAHAGALQKFGNKRLSVRLYMLRTNIARKDWNRRSASSTKGPFLSLGIKE